MTIVAAKALAAADAAAGRRSGDTMMMIDGKFVPFPAGVAYPYFVGFTPDSKHLVWRATGGGADGKPATLWFIDGRQVAAFDQHATQALPTPNDLYEMRPDGSCVVLGRVNGQVTRVTLTPPADSDVALMATEAQAIADQAIAAAAQKKSDAEAAAAKKTADAQKARDDAAAARKKAYDDRIAARKKARDDATAARKKAQEDAAAKRKAAAAAP